MPSSIPSWTNLKADGGFWSHSRTVEDLLTLVVEPGIAALDARIETVTRSDDVARHFELSDLGELREEMLRGYALAIQSAFERQLRGWLVSCAEESGLVGANRVRRDEWDKLQSAFLVMRGLRMEQLGGFEDLDLLQLVGNTCRHGDGPSCDRLKARRPDLWPNEYRRGADGLAIELPLLRTFVAAITAFWTDAEDVYANSLTAKHPSVVRRLAEVEPRWRARVVGRN